MNLTRTDGTTVVGKWAKLDETIDRAMEFNKVYSMRGLLADLKEHPGTRDTIREAVARYGGDREFIRRHLSPRFTDRKRGRIVKGRARRVQDAPLRFVRVKPETPLLNTADRAPVGALRIAKPPVKRRPKGFWVRRDRRVDEYRDAMWGADHRCAACGLDIVVRRFAVVDHFKSIGYYGREIIRCNLTLMHAFCNGAKGEKPMSEGGLEELRDRLAADPLFDGRVDVAAADAALAKYRAFEWDVPADLLEGEE